MAKFSPAVQRGESNAKAYHLFSASGLYLCLRAGAALRTTRFSAIALCSGPWVSRKGGLRWGPDGRFLMIKNEEPETVPINVTLNWFEELKRLVPTP